jgi:hypothetical protein
MAESVSQKGELPPRPREHLAASRRASYEAAVAAYAAAITAQKAKYAADLAAGIQLFCPSYYRHPISI